MLVIFSGLPGTGKTSIARELARQIGAVYLRIDSLEQALRRCKPEVFDWKDTGYQAAYALAEDNLRLGRTVVADSVNPIAITRDAWLDVSRRAGTKALEVEIVCADKDEHRRRVETRRSDICGLRLPNWQEIVARRYSQWDREHRVIDSATCGVAQSVKLVQEWIRQSGV